MRGLSPVAASGGHSSSRCAGLLLSRPLLLWSTGSRRAGSVAVAHGLSCSAACGIFPDQGSNPCALHWQADSQPLRHQGSPLIFINGTIIYLDDINDHHDMTLLLKAQKDFQLLSPPIYLVTKCCQSYLKNNMKSIHVFLIYISTCSFLVEDVELCQ